MYHMCSYFQLLQWGLAKKQMKREVAVCDTKEAVAEQSSENIRVIFWMDISWFHFLNQNQVGGKFKLIGTWAAFDRTQLSLIILV